MNIVTTPFEGLYILETITHVDLRGAFQKQFNYDFFAKNGLDCDFKEFYFFVSDKDVLRGMHFQIPPYEHTKLVYVSKGRILDVVVDLRKSSSKYGKSFSIEIDSRNGECLYIPKGFAHGFLSLEDDTMVHYAQTSCYSAKHDCGIDYNSFGFDWGVYAVVMSNRDATFPKLEDFKSPF